MSKKKREWGPGDIFVVPLEDGSYGLGQVISYEEAAMGSAVCAFFSDRRRDIPSHIESPSEEVLIAVLFVTRDLLDSNRWRVISNGPLLPWGKYLDLKELRRRGFIGVTIVGSFNVTTLMNAYHKLVPWNDFYDPNYLDGLLVSSDRKPANVLLK